MHRRRDLGLGHCRPEHARDAVEDLFRRSDRRAYPCHLRRRLPSAKRVDDSLRGDESIGVRGPGQRLPKDEPQAVRQAVGRGVTLGVVDCDRARGDTLDRAAECGADALVVADDLRVRTELLEARRVKATDDRNALAGCGDEEGALPGAVRARDEVEAGIAGEQRLAHEREPEVDLLLAEDLDGLVELLVHDPFVRGHRRDAIPRDRRPSNARGQARGCSSRESERVPLAAREARMSWSRVR